MSHHSNYSPFRGRSFRTIPSLSRKCSNFTQDRGLVNTSATCSSMLTYWSLWLLSAPCHGCNDIESLCASIYHGIQDSLSSLCNSGCHIGSWLLPQFSKPYSFAASRTRSNVLCFRCAESNVGLLPTLPRDHG
jgi:hypothetical protein